ncbi:MAG: phycobiliprotein lyase [Cyanobacteriota bacterium]|nr:phycobiliprotein lyase [Cyanobacteriota bacterium]
MNTFPPEDIRGFLQLCAGEWLMLRSLMQPDLPEDVATETGIKDLAEACQSWHNADRGELTMTFLDPQDTHECGGLDVALPTGSHVRLIFRRDGSVVLPSETGEWRLAPDGTLELRLEKDGWLVIERIWFSKPNLRLRCTLEQARDGRPGRSSFSSEIRRMRRPVDPSPLPN